MALSTGTVDASEVLALKADKPFLFSHNVVETFNAAPQWRSTGSWASGSDITATGFPTSRVYDRRQTLVTKPNQAGTQVYLIFDLTETASTSALPIDTISIHGNFSSLTTPSIVVIASDNTNFSSPTTLIPQTSISNDRIVWWDLGTNADDFITIYNVRYLRITVNTGASETPEISEVFMGKRHQLSYRPNEPYDDKPLGSDVTDFTSKAGNRTRYKRHSGRAIFNAEWTLSDADAYSIDGITQIRNWWKYADYGAKPFFFCDAPWTNKVAARYTNKAHFCYAEDALLSMSSQGPSSYKAGFTFAEDAPFVETES